MDIKELFTDDDAVSPVIGVILMVAITVILAAVIGAFVLDIGQTQESPPTTTFNWANDGGDETVTLTHDGGDTIDASTNLEVQFSDGGTGGTADVSGDYSSGNTIWTGATSGGSGSGDNTIAESGESSLVWTSSDGDSSETLTEHDWDFS